MTPTEAVDVGADADADVDEGVGAGVDEKAQACRKGRTRGETTALHAWRSWRLAVP